MKLFKPIYTDMYTIATLQEMFGCYHVYGE